MRIFCFVLFSLLLILPVKSFAADSQVIINPQTVSPGQCFTVSVAPSIAAERVEAEFNGRKFNCFRDGESFKAIIGVPIEQKPGKYELMLVGNQRLNPDPIGTVSNIRITPAKFPSVAFWLKPAKKKLLKKELIADEWGRVEKVLTVENPKQAWEGKFALPVTAPISMRFGTIEKINGKKAGQHRGMDLAAPAGTEVAAGNHGKIVFAQVLKAFGGTMVIDHGQGIHTLYFHLSKFLAKVGDEVAKGQAVALSGNSGISSGPHLHWGMSAHNLRVDPMQWTKISF